MLTQAAGSVTDSHGHTHDEPPLLSELTVVCLPAVKLPTVYARERQPRQLRRSHNLQVNSWHLFNAVRERCSPSLQNCSGKVINPLVVTCRIVSASAQTNNFMGKVCILHPGV